MMNSFPNAEDEQRGRKMNSVDTPRVSEGHTPQLPN